MPEEEIGLAAHRLDSRALSIVETLTDAGHEAYVVGGGVRDLLLDLRPKDFDVATSAHPEEVRKLFRRARLIGRRFPIVHVLFGREFVEVTTFRALEGGERHVDESGRIIRDSSYGTLAEDALRRDFTINALYYDPRARRVLDFTGGLQDLRAGVIRLIGAPTARYREDPVRMLRALRFAAKLGFGLDPETEEPLDELAPLLGDIPPARLFEEFGKLFMSGRAVTTYEILRRHGLFGQLFPLVEEVVAAEPDAPGARFAKAALASTDARIAAGDPVTPAFLLAAFLWLPVSRYAAWLQSEENLGEASSVQRAAAVILAETKRRVTVPQRFAQPLREILQLQTRFRYRHGRRAESVLAHPRFRAAYDFLKLRAAAGDADPEWADFWGRVQEMQPEERRAELAPNRRRGRRRAPRP